MQGVVRGGVDKILEWPGLRSKRQLLSFLMLSMGGLRLCPSWHALEVAVADAVHDVKEHEVDRDLGAVTGFNTQETQGTLQAS